MQKLPSRPGKSPKWLAATFFRLDFLTSRYRERGKRKLLADLLKSLKGRDCRSDSGDSLLRYLFAVLDLLELEAESRDDFACALCEIRELCRLARVALRSNYDDRPMYELWRSVDHLPGSVGWAVRVPGRAVWLAAMELQVQKDMESAAVMLINDIAAVNLRIPIFALRSAFLDPRSIKE